VKWLGAGRGESIGAVRLVELPRLWPLAARRGFSPGSGCHGEIARRLCGSSSSLRWRVRAHSVELPAKWVGRAGQTVARLAQAREGGGGGGGGGSGGGRVVCKGSSILNEARAAIGPHLAAGAAQWREFLHAARLRLGAARKGADAAGASKAVVVGGGGELALRRVVGHVAGRLLGGVLARRGLLARGPLDGLLLLAGADRGI